MKRETKEKSRTHLFLDELSALSKKYNIFIGGCGCCGSPYLGSPGKKLEFSEKDRYKVDHDHTEMKFNYRGKELDAYNTIDDDTLRFE